MLPTRLTRRDVLRFMSMGLTGFALESALGARSLLAQSTPPGIAYADEVALSMDEIAQVRTANLRLALNMDQMTSDYNQLIVTTARQVAGDYGVTLVVSDARNDASVQRISMAQLVDQGFSGMFTLPISVEVLNGSLQRANQAGIPVVMLGGRPSGGQIATLLNTTNYLGCFDSASALTQAATGNGKIAIVSSAYDVGAYREGERGVLDAVANTQMELVGLVAVIDEASAAAATTRLLAEHPDLTAIFATWGEALDGALEALDAAGSEVKIAGYGAEVECFRAFDAGNAHLIAMSVERGAVVGRAIVDTLCKAVLQQPLPAEVLMPTLLVTPSNYRTRWNDVYPNLPAPWESAETATPAAE